MPNLFKCFIFRIGVAAFADEDDDVQLIQTRIVQRGPVVDLATSAGQTECLNTHTHSSGWTNYDCDGTGGKRAATWACNSTNAEYRNAVGTVCCAESCGRASTADITTSAGQTECLNNITQSRGWTDYDCDGTGGKRAATWACFSTNAEYRNAVGIVCCAESCGSLSTDITTSAGQPTSATTTTTTTTTMTTTTEATTTEATTTATTPGSPSGGSTETTTTIPGGDTNVGGADCFGAIATFGPDFECNFKVSSFCGHDSADGLDASACCQDYCNSNREKTTKRKVSEREDKATEGVRKSDRRESSSKRKDAEALRKKNMKEAEWLQKRGAQETSNKKAEDERKTKRGYSQSQRTNERSWKANRQTARKNAQRREAARKRERALKGRNNDKGEKRTKKKEALAKNTEKRKKINSKGR